MAEISTDINDLLNKIVNGQIENYEINFEEGHLKSDNFLGDIRFINLKNKTSNEKLYLLLKRSIEALAKFKHFENMYTIEINFYEVVWATLNKFQAQCVLGFDKIPKYYGSVKTKGKEKIILEDLTKQNFRMHDKTKALNKQQYEFIFQTYSTFHAISHAFREIYPEEFARLKSLTNPKLRLSDDKHIPPEVEGFVQHIRKCCDYVSSLFTKEDEEDILRKFKKATDVGALAILKGTTYKGDTPVLLHGDCWSNNLLFKYDVRI